MLINEKYRQNGNESVIFRLTQTIYDFLDEKIVFLNDEQPTIESIKSFTIPQLSPEGQYYLLC